MSSNTQIKAGDKVQLKSGGPEMTVEEVTERGYAKCVWFISDKLETHAFKTIALEIAPDYPSGDPGDIFEN